MTEIVHVPLSRLSLWDGNVRKTDVHAGIKELAASIAAHGLLQSLVVRKGKRGKYDILAGQRRLLALRALVKDGRLAAEVAIPCMLADGESDATELSLAENIVRAPMHPADQFDAFRVLIDAGASIADVAGRFGMAETTVTKRLKLARLSPVILDAYRQGEIDLEAAQAFTVSDDHAAQERVLSALSEWNMRPDSIRRALTEEDIPTSDKRVRLIGIDAYRAAGGVIREDLFDEDGCGYLTDTALLDRLVGDKLAAVRAEVAAEGWAWVEAVPDADYAFLSGFKRLYGQRVELSDADQAEHDQLSEEYDELADSDEDHERRLAEIESRLEALTGADIWSPETLAVGGAVVTIGYDGELRIERGLVRKEDAHKIASDGDDAAASGIGTTMHTNGLSPRLVEDLTAQHSAALAAELLQRPDIALAAVVHAFLLDAFYPGQSVHSCLKLIAGGAGLRGAIKVPDICKGFVAMQDERARIGDRLPGNPSDLWRWLRKRSREELLALLAFVAATTVDAVQRKGDRPKASRFEHAKALCQTLQLDMTAWFTPTAENYFGRVTRGQILVAIDEAKGPHGPALDKLKKSELAARAEQLLAGTTWLPEPLRPAATDGTESVKTLAAE